MPTEVSPAVFGFIASLPLLIGAWTALWRHPSRRVVGLVAAFGAGALLSAVSFELVLDSVEVGGELRLGVFLALGAVVYYAGDKYLNRRSEAQSDGGARGLALLMGATLDGIPESFILGLSAAAGGGVSVPFLLAVVASNLPEGMASVAPLRESGFSETRILRMWAVVVGISALSAGLGGAVSGLGGATGAAAQAFAAGALLTMLIDDFIPEAREKGGISAGLAAVVGFAVAFALNQAGG